MSPLQWEGTQGGLKQLTGSLLSQVFPNDGFFFVRPCKDLRFCWLVHVHPTLTLRRILSHPISSLSQQCFSSLRCTGIPWRDGSNAESDAVSLGRGLRTCISHTLPADTAGPHASSIYLSSEISGELSFSSDGKLWSPDTPGIQI